MNWKGLWRSPDSGGSYAGSAAAFRRRIRYYRPAGLQNVLNLDELLRRMELRAREDRRTHYGAIHSLAAKYGSLSSPICAAEFQVFSQNGEDGILAYLLERYGAPSPFFLEFGAEEGTQGNCLFLSDVLGWPGVFIEADPDKFRKLELKFINRSDVQCVRAFVLPETIDSLCSTYAVPKDCAVVSIDVDGADYWIWQSLKAIRPRVVVIEYNSALPAGRALVQPPDAPPWDGVSANWGGSIEALRRLGVEKGYTLVYLELTGVNAFFVRDDLVADDPDASKVILRSPYYRLEQVIPTPSIADFIDLS